MNSEDKPRPAHSASDDLTQKLLADIDPANLRCGDGHYEIQLGTEWIDMLATLPQIGEALVITGNPCAILGQTRRYPEIDFCPGGRHARSLDGHFDFEFVPWSAARLIRRQYRNKVSHLIEFRDESNATFHKIGRTDQTDPARFVEWVQDHQASGRRAASDSPVPPARWRTVRQRHWFDYDEIEPAGSRALLRVLEAAQRQERPLTAVVGNEGITQSATFIPQSLIPLDSWIFASDDVAAFHFDLEALGETLIHHLPPPPGHSPFSSLRSFDESGNLRCALLPPPGTPLSEWTEFLREAAVE
ncbi:MAG TPA: ChuX/HutX family heme-like substrate-binding protein [Chthoniobacterales bacterium]